MVLRQVKPASDARADPTPMRWAIIGIAIAFLTIFVVVPLLNVFAQALSKGLDAYVAAIEHPDALAAIELTLIVAAISVGAQSRIRHRPPPGPSPNTILPARVCSSRVVDLPFSVSPVIAGLVFVLLFGAQGYLGPWLQAHDIKIIFALPGIVLATVFVTFPFRRTRVDSAHAGAGTRTRRLRCRSARRACAPSSGNPAEREMGAALRRAVVQRAGDGRVRRGLGGLRPRARRDQHHAAARRDSLQRVPVHGRIRGGVAAGAAGDGDPRSQSDAGSRVAKE
jgi:ABC-type sugar transport system permease subunit